MIAEIYKWVLKIYHIDNRVTVCPNQYNRLPHSNAKEQPTRMSVFVCSMPGGTKDRK